MSASLGADKAYIRAIQRTEGKNHSRNPGGGRKAGSKDVKRRKNLRYHWTVADLKTKFLARIEEWSPLMPPALRSRACWLWTGATTRGFGYMVWASRQDFGGKSPRMAAHRLSWILFRGRLEKKELVGQMCGHKLCVNPQHLFTWRR